LVDWLEVSWVIDSADRAQLETLLEAQGAVSISAENASTEAAFETALGADADWLRLRVAGLFATAQAPEAIQAAIEAALGSGVSEGQWRRFEERDWVAEWSQALTPLQISERLWVVPHSQPVPAGAAVVVRLDPGIAFGSGTHETTRLCLEWLAQQSLGGCRVVDFGCGSGILGIAALQLGAQHVCACDIDPQAIAVTAENARHNGVASHLQVSLPANLPSVPCDIVLANILLPTLVENASLLAALVLPQGRIVMSGVLQSQSDALIAAFAADCSDFEVRQRNDWVCVIARRRLPGDR
jgi:ribosomal protein L11 methyltransferase